MNILLVIPAYNCEKQITRVLDEIDDEILNAVNEIWIIDNRSSDLTVSNALSYKITLGNKLRIFRTRQNNNLGGTHKIAFRKALELDYTHVAIVHGDNQAEMNDLKKILKTSNLNNSKTIFGARFMIGSKLHGYSLARVIGNFVLNLFYSAYFMKPIYDLGSGMNLYRLEDIANSNYMNYPNDLTYNYHLTRNFLVNKIDFDYVPITWREYDQVSNAKNLRVFFKGLSTLIGLKNQHHVNQAIYEIDEVIIE